MSEPQDSAPLRVQAGADGVTLHLSGRLDARTSGGLWRRLRRALHEPSDVVVDASAVTYCDLSGVGVLLELRRRQQAAGRGFRLLGLAEEFQRLMEPFEGLVGRELEPAPSPHLPLPEVVGRATVAVWEHLHALVAFVGELAANFGRVVSGRQRVRWADTLQIAESAGVRAVPIITLMGTVLGLIIAFQGAVPLRRYGGEVLVADMVVLAMFREMGPLFTAILLAARSASAFAAELGTMKVNEEIDALRTMGLEPVAFLAVPRVAAAVLVTPLLTLHMNAWGLFGGGVVYLSMGLDLETYIERILLRGTAGDLAGGLFRSLVFGIIVAGVGCLQGLRTGRGARSVGESTTRSVVSSIILIIIADGLISVMFYSLGL